MKEAYVPGCDIKFVHKDDDRNLTTFANGLCKIKTESDLGSGFLCGFKCGANECVWGMFTNNHVLDRQQEYNMIRGSSKMKISHDRVECFWTNETIDVTFVRFTRAFTKILKENGWYYFAVADEETSVGSPVTILQHPEGERASVSKGEVIYCSENTLHYTASTLPGSSGSPLIDTDYRVFGIHKQSGLQRGEHVDNQGVKYNVGTPIQCAIGLMSSTSRKALIGSYEIQPNSSSANEKCGPIKKFKRPADQPSPSTSNVSAALTDGGSMNDLRKELDDIRRALKLESVEKENLARKIQVMDDELNELKQRKEQGCETQTFSYSDEARQRAAMKKFGFWGCYCRKAILCSASGLFIVDSESLGSGVDWCAQWRNIVGGGGETLYWRLMMPYPIDNLVIWMNLLRQNDYLIIKIGYYGGHQPSKAPANFTIDCVVSVVIEHMNGTSTTQVQQKQCEMNLRSSSDFGKNLMTFPPPSWSSVNPLKVPTVKIQLKNVEL